MLLVLFVLLALAAGIFSWQRMMTTQSVCPLCGHRRTVARIGIWIYPTFYCIECRYEWSLPGD
jgi:transposase-like protein